MHVALIRLNIVLVRTRFYIERRKDEQGRLMLSDRPVFMSVSFSGVRLMLSTGVKSDMQAWDHELQRMKSAYPGSDPVNSWLQVLDETAGRTWEQLAAGVERPDAATFRSLFNELKPGYSSGFFEVFFRFMEEGIMRWRSGTYQKVKTICAHLREFEQWSGSRLAFSSMDESFPPSFSEFYREKGNSPSTTRKAINILVWFLNWAASEGYHRKRDYKGFYQMLEVAEPVPRKVLYLKREELLALEGLRVETRREERARDLFLFMCYTGLRFSELQRLKKEDVSEQGIQVRRNQKSSRELALDSQAREIMLKYINRYYLDNAAFPPMNVLTLDRYIRILAQRAGINRRISGGEGEALKVPLYEKLTAAAGFNTFKQD